MLRSTLLKTAAYAKADGVADFLIRYNPVLRPRIQALLSESNDALLARALEAAGGSPVSLSTEYSG